MSTPFSRPVRNRINIMPDEYRAAASNLFALFKLASAMVVLNLVLPFSRETFHGHFLPAIVVFSLAGALSLARRLFGPRNVKGDEIFSLVTIGVCVGLWLYGKDLIVSQRLLGQWLVPNVLAGFSAIDMLGLVIAALLIPRDDCWSPLRVAAFLAGACLIGAGMPDGVQGSPNSYVGYLAGIGLSCLCLIELDMLRCFVAFCATSPLTNTEGAKKILNVHATDNPLLFPFVLLFDGDRMIAAAWRAYVLWFSMWPNPPESLDPHIPLLAHSRLMRSTGIRRFLVALSYAALFAMCLVKWPPASYQRPYLIFAAELLAPPIFHFALLVVCSGQLLLKADLLSREFQKGNP